MYQIFLSYARQDRDVAQKLVEEFRSRGWSVWWDEDIRAGDDWYLKITATIDRNLCVVVLWSRASVKSKWVDLEAGYGLIKHKLVPAKIDSIDIPSPFRSVQTANLINWSPGKAHKGFDGLIASLEHLIASRGAEQLDLHETDEQNVRTNLSALRRSVVFGSRLLCVSMIIGLLLTILTQIIWQVMPTSVEKLPLTSERFGQMILTVRYAGTAQLILTIGVGVLAWTGWSYLRQALKLQRNLEFQMDVPPHRIMEVLSGSSLISVNTIFFRVLCIVLFFALNHVLVGVLAAVVMSLLLNTPDTSSLFLYSAVLQLFVSIPFLHIGFFPWVRWFNPLNWSVFPRLFKRYITRALRSNFREALSTASIRGDLNPNILEALDGELGSLAEGAIPDLDAAMARTLRRIGLVRFLREFDIIWEKELEHHVANGVAEIVNRLIPAKPPEYRVKLVLELLGP